MASIRIYAGPSLDQPLGTADLEHDDEPPRPYNSLDGFKVSRISPVGNGWNVIQVSWLDRPTGQYHNPVYYQDGD